MKKKLNELYVVFPINYEEYDLSVSDVERLVSWYSTLEDAENYLADCKKSDIPYEFCIGSVEPLTHTRFSFNVNTFKN